MKINKLYLLEGAKAARGITVIIDVFRAFTTEAYFLNGGAKCVIPVGERELALKYKEEYENSCLCGERGGVKLEGFDYGNSPSEIENKDFTGKTVIHTTSAGTQGIVNAKFADEIIGGSLVSASAIARYIKMKDPEEVSLVAMGLDAISRTEEDDLAALYIESILRDDPIEDIQRRADALRYTSGAKFFDPAQSSVFPTRDFALCTEVDKFPFILRLDKPKDSPAVMNKYEL
jgi:2-phosphosulfolactate phosphatase